MLLKVDVTFGVVLAVLLVAATGTTALAHLGRAREIATAGVRAAVQLGAVSLVIGWVVGSVPAPLLAFIVLMYAVAVRTAGRRITANGTWWWAAVPIGAGVAPVVAVLLLTGLVPVKGIALIPITGILIGGALTATVLGGGARWTNSARAGARWRPGSRSVCPTGTPGWRWRARRRPTRCCRGWTRRGRWGW